MVGIIRKIPDFNNINSGRFTEIDMTHASTSCSTTKRARQKRYLWHGVCQELQLRKICVQNKLN
jgi:hypothetical protein